MGGDILPDVEKIDPRSIQKDTVMLTERGYVVIRIKADNPGKWFFHCHIEFHAMDGKLSYKRISIYLIIEISIFSYFFPKDFHY